MVVAEWELAAQVAALPSQVVVVQNQPAAAAIPVASQHVDVATVVANRLAAVAIVAVSLLVVATIPVANLPVDAEMLAVDQELETVRF